ncbi:AAA family ATPase [Streptomyces sp. NPDC059679]|uniref:AAA family ATPase n=1 Tax=Streptomyces sp. NPDC059679 TaxID=3346903 RepID=UPI003687A2F4
MPATSWHGEIPSAVREFMTAAKAGHAQTHPTATAPWTAGPPPMCIPGALVVMIGAAGAGKTHCCQDWPRDAVVSLDELRERVAGDAGDQRATREAVQLQHLIINARLRRRLTTVVDATNLEENVRQLLLLRAHRHHCPAIATLVRTPLAVCETRNARRPANRCVPLATLRWQHAQANLTPQQLLMEGFDAVQLVDAGPDVDEVTRPSVRRAPSGPDAPHTLIRPSH